MSTLEFRFERKGFSLRATAPLEPIVAGMPNSRRFLFGDYSIALDHTVFGTEESGPDSLRVLELQLTRIWSQPRPLSAAGLSDSECFWYLASLQEFETAEMDDEVAHRRWTMGESHRLLPGCPAFDGHNVFFADDASGTRVFWLERREAKAPRPFEHCVWTREPWQKQQLSSRHGSELAMPRGFGSSALQWGEDESKCDSIWS